MTSPRKATIDKSPDASMKAHSSSDGPDLPPRVSPRRFLVEGIIFITYVAFGMSWAAAGSFLKEIMAELSLNLSQASFVSTSVSMAKILGPTLAGFVSARLGLRWAFMAASALMCLGILAPIAPNYGLLLLARFAMGLGGALVVVYFTPLVMQWFPRKEWVAINGLNYVSISVGMMIGLFATPPLMKAMGGSWRNTLVIYSLLSVGAALMWLLWGGEKDNSESEITKSEDPGDSEWLKALWDANTWKLTFTYCGLLSLYLVIITYFPTFYRKAFPPGSLALLAPSVVMFAGIPATFAGTFLSWKSGLRIPLVRYSGIILVPATIGMFLPKNPVVILASAVALGVGMFLWRSPFFTIPQELPGVSPGKACHIMGIFWAVSYGVATFNVWLVGKLAESSVGFEAGFWVITVVSASMFIGSFLIPETGPGRLKPAME